MGGFIVHLYLDAAGGAAEPELRDHGDDGQEADRELEPVGVDVARGPGRCR